MGDDWRSRSSSGLALLNTEVCKFSRWINDSTCLLPNEMCLDCVSVCTLNEIR